jgi:hypothetical protein
MAMNTGASPMRPMLSGDDAALLAREHQQLVESAKS